MCILECNHWKERHSHFTQMTRTLNTVHNICQEMLLHGTPRSLTWDYDWEIERQESSNIAQFMLLSFAELLLLMGHTKTMGHSSVMSMLVLKVQVQLSENQKTWPSIIPNTHLESPDY